MSRTTADRAALDGLIAGADVLVTDLAPAEAERLGLRYEDVAAANPELIHCNVTPFGERGPLRDKPGGEIVLQAMGDIWRYLGALDEPPLRLGADASAMAAGIFAMQGVMAAVIHHARGGNGQKVEVSELGALLAIETQLNASQSNDSLSGGWHLSAPTDPPEYDLSARDLAVDFGFVRDTERVERCSASASVSRRMSRPIRAGRRPSTAPSTGGSSSRPSTPTPGSTAPPNSRR